MITAVRDFFSTKIQECSYHSFLDGTGKKTDDNWEKLSGHCEWRHEEFRISQRTFIVGTGSSCFFFKKACLSELISFSQKELSPFPQV